MILNKILDVYSLKEKESDKISPLIYQNTQQWEDEIRFWDNTRWEWFSKSLVYHLQVQSAFVKQTKVRWTIVNCVILLEASSIKSIRTITISIFVK